MYGRFILLVTLLTIVDDAVITGVIWLSLEITGSSMLLGSVLGLSVAIPFVLERCFGRQLTCMSPAQLIVLRGAAGVVVLGLIAAGSTARVDGFLAVALIVGVVEYFSVTVFESQNARVVVSGQLSAERASRWIQTALQLGHFGGAMIGGLLLERMSRDVFLVWGGVAGLVLCPVLLLMPVFRAAGVPGQGEEAAAGPEPSLAVSGLVFGRNGVTLWLGCIGLFGLHVGAFNSMVPVVFQALRQWDAAAYGLASGLGGVGAFAAAILPSVRIRRAVLPIALVLCDILIVQSVWMPLAGLAALLWGYVFNGLRIGVRQQLLAGARSESDADWIGSRSTYANLSAQAIGPLVLTALVTEAALSPGAAPGLFIGTGIVLALAMFAAASTQPQTQAVVVGGTCQEI